MYYDTFLNSPRVIEIHANSDVHREENLQLQEERKDKVIYSQNITSIKKRLELYPDYYAL